MFLQALTLDLIPFILFLFFLYKGYQQRLISNKNLPPSPPKLPILGNIHQLGTHPYRYLKSLSDTYGELMMIRLGSKPALIVSSARAAREILVTHDVTFADRPISKKGEKLLHNCKDVAAASYDEHWKEMRSICVHLLSKKSVRSFRRKREEEITLLIGKIRQSTCSSPVNLSELFQDFTNGVVCRVVFGRKFCEKKDGFNFNKLMKEFTKLVAGFCFADFIPWLAWIDCVNGWDAKVEKMAKQFDDIFEKVIKKHKDGLDDHGRMVEGGDNNENVKDFVDVLLGLQKDHATGFPIDQDSMKALMMDMLGAGTNSSFSLLEWTMTELLRHPQVLKKLKNEVRKFTKEEEIVVKEEDLEHMKYLKAVIKETLRLHTPVPLLMPRLSTQDTKICGYNIPKGTIVIINGWAIHRDPASWDEPEKFNPERFLNSPKDYTGHDLDLFSFGAGRRKCPGISFTMRSTEVLLANLMHKFDWTLPDGAGREELDMSECYTINMSKNTPLLAVACTTT